MDAIDHSIVALLRRDARMSMREIARRVGLSAAPVARRVARMEDDGIIVGYTAVINDSLTGKLEAFTEIRLNGEIESGEIEAIAEGIPEITQVFTIAGDPDALIHIRADNVDHVQRVVNAMRRTGKVAGTKTLIILRSWGPG